MIDDKLGERFREKAIEMLIPKAQSGDQIAAMSLLEIATPLIARGEPLPEPLRAYLADALTDITDHGKNAHSALGLVGTQGKSDGVIIRRRKRDSVIYQWSLELANEGYASASKQALMITKHLSGDAESIRKAWNPEDISDDELVQLFRLSEGHVRKIIGQGKARLRDVTPG